MKNDNLTALLNQLTLEEKAALCSGIDNWNTTPISRLNILSVTVADGPHGVRREYEEEGIGNIFKKSIPSTCFPTAVTLAATWNKDLLFKVGEAIASECLDQGVQVILGPGINIKRNPLCGRNFEYFSEDPFLAGSLAASYINGVQSLGIGTSLKHYALNSQEHKRMKADSVVDERTMREIYLKPFEIAVKNAKPTTIMCSYNPVNGTHASENKYLLTDILRKDWEYEGIVISDWGAVNNRVKGILAGLNVEMPSSNGESDEIIIEAVKSGALQESDLNKCVLEILSFVDKLSKSSVKKEGYKADYSKNHLLAKCAATEGSVLLKNDDGILPFNNPKKLTVIGNLAKTPRYQGSGSSMIEPIELKSFVDALENSDISFEFSEGYSLNDCSESKTNSLISDAVKLAKGKDNVVVFIGLTEDFESEAYDRNHLSIPSEHIKLLEELNKVNKNIVAVLVGGSAVLTDWSKNVKALLNVYLGGEAGGEAVLDLILGKANPSGKLAETYPLSLDDIPSTKNFETDVVEYRESIFVGYRYFDKAQVPVAFPFGFGLSYTNFEYSLITLDKEEITENDTLNVSFKLKNIGNVDGAEVVQLYIKDTESTLFNAEKELKAFDKVFLKAGEEKEVKFELSKSCFEFYNVEEKRWTVESGNFDILIASSAQDIKLKGSVNFKAKKINLPNVENLSAYYDIKNIPNISKEQFEQLLGHSVAIATKPRKGTYDMNTLVGELDHGCFARLFRFIFLTASTKVIPKDSSKVVKEMTKRGAGYMPIRNFYLMSAGAVNKAFVDNLLIALNGKVIRGMFKAIKALGNKKVKKKDIYK